jgi:hypothetical protein
VQKGIWKILTVIRPECGSTGGLYFILYFIFCRRLIDRVAPNYLRTTMETNGLWHTTYFQRDRLHKSYPRREEIRFRHQKEKPLYIYHKHSLSNLFLPHKTHASSEVWLLKLCIFRVLTFRGFILLKVSILIHGLFCSSPFPLPLSLNLEQSS